VPNPEAGIDQVRRLYFPVPASMALSRKKFISERCNRAPFLYKTGKPAPEILFPRAKSIILYCEARSQCGTAGFRKFRNFSFPG